MSTSTLATPIERTPNIGRSLAAELRACGIDSLEVQVRALLQSRVDADMAYWQCDPSGQAPAVYLGLPHRLDRPVAGVRWNHLPPKVRADIRQRVKAARV